MGAQADLAGFWLRWGLGPGKGSSPRQASTSPALIPLILRPDSQGRLPGPPTISCPLDPPWCSPAPSCNTDRQRGRPEGQLDPGTTPLKTHLCLAVL